MKMISENLTVKDIEELRFNLEIFTGINSPGTGCEFDRHAIEHLIELSDNPEHVLGNLEYISGLAVTTAYNINDALDDYKTHKMIEAHR